MNAVELSNYDRDVLSGKYGEAARIAIQVILEIARIQRAQKLIDISKVHIGGSIYTGQGSLKVIESLADLGGKVRVPTTINSISIDRQRWREQGIDEEFAGFSERLAKAFESMGAIPIFSCTPYVFPDAPVYGQDIVWAESNAIVFANSVLGARTNRHGDFLDICAAITGRAPYSGLHLEINRRGEILFEMPDISDKDTYFFSILGYLIGKHSGSAIPVIDGITEIPSLEQLKAFCSTISTAGPVGLFHMVGVTPEAASCEQAFGGNLPVRCIQVTREELENVWLQMSTGRGSDLDLVVMGSPHFTLGDCEELASLVANRRKNEKVDFLITTNRFIYEQAKDRGFIREIEKFGARFSTDTCLCMLNERIIGNAKVVMTNSGKFAHYGPGLINRGVYFANTADCVNSAVEAYPVLEKPKWLLV